jgi:hypothetical protein
MDVWSIGFIKFQKSYFPGPDFMQVAEGLFMKCDEEELVQFAGLVRRVWLRRNDVIHGGSLSHPRTIMQQTLSSIHDFTLAQTRERQKQYPSGAPSGNGWRAPALGCCKGNWDSALETDSAGSDRIGGCASRLSWYLRSSSAVKWVA